MRDLGCASTVNDLRFSTVDPSLLYSSIEATAPALNGGRAFLYVAGSCDLHQSQQPENSAHIPLRD